MNEHLKPLLRVEGLECTRNDMVLFTGLDFSLIPGEVIQIDGPNGCGKTSLLRIICGLAQAAEGHVYWNGKDINDYAPAFLAQVNYIGHQNGIKNELTPLENLDIARKLSFSTTSIAQVMEALRTFGLAGYEYTPVRMLSSGQRRRAALSRLLLNSGSLWVLDEPFTSVDDAGRKLIQSVIESHIGNGGMLILATHEPITITNSKFTRMLLNEWK